MIDVSGRTRLIAILGDPVEHSRSPAMHNAAFAALGLDYVYLALRVVPADLRRALAGVRALGLAGLNVTVPHKERILPLLDEVSPLAREIGAVNTVVRRSERLVGDNTDGRGFARALARGGFRPRGKRVVLLGAGGSARAVGWTLVRAGAARITVLNRTAGRAAMLARWLGRGGRTETASGPLDQAEDARLVRDADLIVNCTSIGLDGRSRPPLAISATPPGCRIQDLVYGSRDTPLVRQARRLGRTAEGGLAMLLEQAALAFRLWTARSAPLEIMERALRGTPGRPSRR
ncbi:MAG: shikimate dehydrogenase [Candidatus Binatota bacterium]|nr:shikimate dehydrogenase [Candidatus Binatota bacterium]